MTAQLEFGLNSIGQISVTTHDVDRAEAFYRDQLGMRFLYRFGDLVFFDCGGVRLMLSVPEPEFDHPSSVIYYTVNDIGAAYETLQKRGVVFRDAPHKIAELGTNELWMSFFRDPDDNLLALMSEIPKSGPAGPGGAGLAASLQQVADTGAGIALLPVESDSGGANHENRDAVTHRAATGRTRMAAGV